MPTWVTLYRSVGQTELNLIAENYFKKFSLEVLVCPIFFPICNEDYALEIAQKWYKNRKPVYVVEFNIEKLFISQYFPHSIESNNFKEYWISIQDFDKFNASIVGDIEIIVRLL